MGSFRNFVRWTPSLGPREQFSYFEKPVTLDHPSLDRFRVEIDQGVVSTSGTNAGARQKAPAARRSALAAAPLKPFACVIRSSAGSCSGSPALCAAGGRRNRVTSRLYSRVHSGDEFTVPVRRVHHRELHRSGDEAGWWRRLELAKKLSSNARARHIKGKDFDCHRDEVKSRARRQDQSLCVAEVKSVY